MDQHIQKPCKAAILGAFFCFLLISCGSSPSPVVQTVQFVDDSVSFQNGKCTVSVTLLNTSDQIFTISFLSSTFQDAQEEPYRVELEYSDLASALNPITIGGKSFSKGTLTFDLSSSGLQPPITGTLVFVGVSGSQATNFVGNFTCD